MLIILIIALIIVIATIALDLPNKLFRAIYKKQYTEYVSKYSTEYNIDENLIYAVIKAESNFDKNAKSNKNAIGLMQLMENTAKDVIQIMDLQIEDNQIEEKLQDADTNINLGTKYLSMLINKYNNIQLSIAAYNAGIGTVDKWINNGIIKKDGSDIENIPYKETNNYVRKILRDYRIYASLN